MDWPAWQVVLKHYRAREINDWVKTMSIENEFGLQTGDRCEIVRSCDPEEALICRVIDVSEYCLLAEHADDDGEDNGIVCVALESIWRVRFETPLAQLIFAEDSPPTELKAPASVNEAVFVRRQNICHMRWLN